MSMTFRLRDLPYRYWGCLSTIGVVCAAAFFSPGVFADEKFPQRPIEIVVPIGPGGATDVATRMLAERWRECLGQPIVIANKPGAAGAVGTRQVAEAKPDGYVLLAGVDSALVAQPVLRKDSGFDVDSFSYLMGYGLGAVLFVVNEKSEWKTLEDFIASAKRNPGKLTYSSFGTGGIPHFTAEHLWETAGVKLVHVPYSSSPEAARALVGGHVDMAVTAGSTGVKGVARILGVAGETRWPNLPDVPTLIEQGYPVKGGFLSSLAAPSAVPEAVKEKLVQTLRQCMQQYAEQLRAPFLNVDQILVQMDGAEVSKLYKERQVWFRNIATKLNLLNP
jgi:tripartite-type tricarboxylate transporter receptor subunit TctC